MEDGHRARGRLRTFALGGAVGAAGAIATFRRRRNGLPRRPRAAGPALAAFEDAPCFLELVGDEARRYRDETGGTTDTDVSNDV